MQFIEHDATSAQVDNSFMSERAVEKARIEDWHELYITAAFTSVTLLISVE